MDDDVRSLLDAADHVLIAFDGPLCSFADPSTARATAERLRILLGPDLPRKLASTDDPFEVLRYAQTCGEHTAHVVERQLSWFEAQAAMTAGPAEGALEAVRTLYATGHTVTVVGNQSTEAVRTFVVMHELHHEARRISARSGARTRLLPDPFLLTEVVEALGTTPQRCLFIGSSAQAAEAGQEAGIPVLGCGRAPRRRGTAATVGSMAELARPVDLSGWPTRR